MNDVTAPPLLTSEDLLAMPEQDGFDYELIRGELRQYPATLRNFSHSRTTTNIASVLKSWLEKHPGKGLVLTGEAGFCLRHDPDTTVGIDVAYIFGGTGCANSTNRAAGGWPADSCRGNSFAQRQA